MKKNIKMIFSLMQIAFWCSFASFTTFWVSYLSSKGVNASFIGFMISINTIIAFIGQIFWGKICDRYRTNKKIYYIQNFLLIIFYILAFMVDNLYLITLLYALIGFVQFPISINLDTWILGTYADKPENYGPIRSAGSLGYALFCLIYGNLLLKYGYKIMPIFGVGFVVINIFLCSMVSDIVITKIKKSQNRNNKLFSPNFIFVLLILLLLGISTTPIVQLPSLIVKNVGGTTGHLGYFMFIMGISQVPVMVLSKKMNNVSNYVKLFIAIVMNGIAMFMMGYAKTPLFLMICSGIYGSAFGLLIPTMRQLIGDIAPTHLLGTAQSLSDGVYNNIAGSISGFLAGVIIEKSNVTSMLYSYSLFLVLPAVMMIGYLFILTDKYRIKESL